MDAILDDYHAHEAAKAAVPVRAKMKRPEHELQVMCTRALKLALPPGCVFQANDPSGVGAREGARRRARGVKAGWPDLEVGYKGRMRMVELKAPKGVLSPQQVATHRELREAGFEVFICRSVEDMLDCLRASGIPLRARVMG